MFGQLVITNSISCCRYSGANQHTVRVLNILAYGCLDGYDRLLQFVDHGGHGAGFNFGRKSPLYALHNH